MTIINEKAYKILENSIVKNAVSHFYIFHGPKNVGKKNRFNINDKYFNSLLGKTNSE